ncbi:hypothetical protein [Undibacterium pigrum]|uniref:Uncharacterized protein n=1 Tax=Undibacterium pigrum TaxID=401470 RepID=A0A318IWW4_9BURK|nr:hypothetical protein [Undibacterium pigrum]PXX34935.1 hypothetical protein DFR42_12414 [Undibacterium pigrum]
MTKSLQQRFTDRQNLILSNSPTVSAKDLYPDGEIVTPMQPKAQEQLAKINMLTVDQVRQMMALPKEQRKAFMDDIVAGIQKNSTQNQLA